MNCNRKSKSKQLDEGNATEKYIAKFFKQREYWAHIFASKGGQPCDIVVIKNDRSWLIDAKHLRAEEASFPFERIEPNQITAFKLATEFANCKNVGFVIFFERTKELFWFSYTQYLEMSQKGKKSVNYQYLRRLEEVVEEYENINFK